MADEWGIIASTLANPQYKWRTIDGLAEETGLDRVTIVSSMSTHEDSIIKSSIPSKDGKELFTTREHYRRNRSPWQAIASAITNKVA